MVRGRNRQGRALQLSAHPNADHQPLPNHDGEAAYWKLREHMHFLNSVPRSPSPRTALRNQRGSGRMFIRSQNLISGGFMKKLANSLLLLALIAGLQANSHAQSSFTDNFSFYTLNTCLADSANFGPWTSAFAGFGCVQIRSNGTQSWLDESPK